MHPCTRPPYLEDPLHWIFILLQVCYGIPAISSFTQYIIVRVVSTAAVFHDYRTNMIVFVALLLLHSNIPDIPSFQHHHCLLRYSITLHSLIWLYTSDSGSVLFPIFEHSVSGWNKEVLPNKRKEGFCSSNVGFLFRSLSFQSPWSC